MQSTSSIKSFEYFSSPHETIYLHFVRNYERLIEPQMVNIAFALFLTALD